MSTPISDLSGRAARAAACLAVVALLAGCGGGFRLGGADAPTEVAVTSDLVVVTGPEGYCVDPTATRNSGDTGFVLMGNCAAIANSRRVIQPATPAILTAAVSEASDGGRLSDSMADLDAFFRSEDGLRLISRSGDAGTVTVLETLVEGDVFLLHAADTSEGAIDGVQDDYWRAYLDVGNRLATLSVIALEDRALSREESLGTLRDFVTAVQGANAAPAVTEGAVPAPVEPVPQVTPPEGGRLFNIGLFRRILG
jgi:hypothetical protein